VAAALAGAPRPAAAAPEYAAAAVAQAATAGPATELDVALDPDARRIAGHARLRVVNDGPAPMS
jgi:hypothetical protein